MEHLDFESLIEDIKNIDDDKRYWFVRTMGGQFFDTFKTNDFIAVGCNLVSLSDLNTLPKKPKKAQIALREILKSRYPEDKSAGRSAAMILKFVREMKVGDVIVIPSANSSRFAFGEIVGDPYEVEHDENECLFHKRRTIEWKASKRRSVLPPLLQLPLISQHALSDITAHSTLIDSVMNSFYTKDDTANLVLKINTTSDVTLDDFCALNSIPTLIEGFCNEYGIDFKRSDIVLKIQMESPGWLRLTGKGVLGILFVGLVINSVCGGGIEFDSNPTGTTGKIYTKGILGAWSEYLDKEADRELKKAAVRAVDSMQIGKPVDIDAIVKLIEAQNQIRNKY